jgi:RNA polymerase sigma factor (sigma-70 family)
MQPAMVRKAVGSLRCTLPRHLEMDDLLAMGNLALVRATRTWDPQKDPEGRADWLWHKVRYGVLDILRDTENSRRKVIPPIFEIFREDFHGRAIAADQDRQVLYRELHAAIDRLPARYQSVIHMRYLLEMSVEETAAIMGCGQSNVGQLTMRALRRLREEMS